MSLLRRAWARAVGDDVAGYFSFALHRLVIGLLLVVALVAQTVLALDAVQPDTIIERQLLANESDANSVVTVQRESFNVALALSDWSHGAATARDVQIARALLSQRLTVVTQSRVSTAANVGSPYLAALAAVDEIILGLEDHPLDHAAMAAREFEPVVQTFLTETRALNEIFQQLGREQVQLLLEANLARQRIQTALQVAIMVLLGALSVSVAVALGRGYRRVSGQLEAQRQEVARARHNLDLVRELDAGIAPLLRAVDSGTPGSVVVAGLKGMLDALPTGYVWTVSADGEGEVSPGFPMAMATTPTAIIPTTVPAPDHLADEEVELVQARARSVVDALRRREGAAQAAADARRRDTLTGLANRAGFLELLQRLIVADTDASVVVCLLDIDRFGEVNGALGFAGADRVLIELAGRLEDVVGATPGAVVARVAADEFAVAFPVDEGADGTPTVERLRTAATYLSEAGGMEAAISVTVGEAIGRGVDAQELLRRAVVAMLLAKDATDRRGHVRFDPVAHHHLSSTLEEEVAVRDALRAGEFGMHYQPIVDLASGRAVGLEALVRWDRPGVGLVAPREFLPVVARSGFAVEFGFEVITDVLATWKRSLRAALVEVAGPSSYVSVNVDAAQLADPGFEHFVLSALGRVDMEPRELVLELTEHAAIDDAHAATLGRLRTAGVRIAIDDFGSGYSSLGQSTRLPVDVLKLDRSFITSLLASDHDRGIFVDLARLGRTLGMGVVAEGVETREVADLLLTAGIVTGQGFLFSPALPEREVVRWVLERGAGSVSRVGPVGHDVPAPVTAGH
jgi:diguanylate cyclase (GGDEF)-like protein